MLSDRNRKVTNTERPNQDTCKKPSALMFCFCSIWTHACSFVDVSPWGIHYAVSIHSESGHFRVYTTVRSLYYVIATGQVKEAHVIGVRMFLDLLKSYKSRAMTYTILLSQLLVIKVGCSENSQTKKVKMFVLTHAWFLMHASSLATFPAP